MNRRLLLRVGILVGFFLLSLGTALAGPQLEVTSQTINGPCCHRFTFAVSPTVFVNRIDLLKVPAGITVTSATATAPVLATHTDTTARWQSSGTMNAVSVEVCFDGITGPTTLIFEGLRAGTSLVVRDTITVTCAPSGCVSIVNEEITCASDPAGNPMFVWKFQVKNESSSCQISGVNFQSVNGGTLPSSVTFSPVILPGETSAQKSITITGAQPGSIVTVTLQAVGGGMVCCTKDYKITLPQCPPPSGCYDLTVDSIKCTPTAPNASILFYTLKNTSSIPRCSLMITVPGGTILPQTSIFSSPIQPGQTVHLNTLITGLAPGTHTFTASFCGCPPNNGAQCCTDSFTATVPDCAPPQPAPCLTTTTNTIMFGMISGTSGTSTITIINSSNTARFYSITPPTGNPAVQFTFTPSTFTLQPGAFITVTITATATDPNNLPSSFSEIATFDIATAAGAPICSKKIPLQGGFIQTSGAALSSNGMMMITGEEEGIPTTSITVTNSDSSPLQCAFDMNSLSVSGAYDFFRPITLADTTISVPANSNLEVKFLFHSDNPAVRPESIRARLSRAGVPAEEILIALQSPASVPEPTVTATAGRFRIGAAALEYNAQEEGTAENPSTNLGLVPGGDVTFTTEIRCLPGVDSTIITGLSLENSDGSPVDPAIVVTAAAPLPITLVGPNAGLSVTITAPQGSLERIVDREKGGIILGKSATSSKNNARLVIHGDDGGEYDPQTGAVRPVGTLGITVGQTESPALDGIRGGTEFGREGIRMVGVVNPTDGKLMGKSATTGKNNARGTEKDQANPLNGTESAFRIDPTTFPLEIPPHGIAWLPVEYTGTTDALALETLTLYLEDGDSLSTELSAIGEGTTGVRSEEGKEGRTAAFALQTAPQPTTGMTTITFHMTKPERTTLKLFNSRGMQVLVPIRDRSLEAGDHAVTLNLDSLPSGTYYYSLQIGDEVAVRPLTITR